MKLREKQNIKKIFKKSSVGVHLHFYYIILLKTCSM